MRLAPVHDDYPFMNQAAIEATKPPRPLVAERARRPGEDRMRRPSEDTARHPGEDR